MQSVRTYLQRNKIKIDEIYKASCKENQLPATKLYIFFQEIFKIQQIKFTRKGKDYFKGDDNQSHTQKIIQQYYKATPNGKKAKFYLYRISFGYAQIEEYLQYWLASDKLISVDYPNQKMPIKQEVPTKVSPQKSIPPTNKQPPSVPQQKPAKVVPPPEQPKPKKEIPAVENEFLHVQQKVPLNKQDLHNQLLALKQALTSPTTNAQLSMEISKKIQLYKLKLQEFKAKQAEAKIQKIKSQGELEKIKTEGSRSKKEVNFKLLFEFYAKQNHLSCVKSSFQQIQHSTQTINYQKLVYFLKEYDIFPQKSKDQKRVHNLYVKMCSSTRDLHFPQFIQLLQRLPEILFDGPQSYEAKKQKLINKIQSRQDKNKLLYNPFHSLEKNNFRIDSQNLKYSFKLQPINGKLEQQITSELSSRKKQKQLQKEEYSKQKKQIFLLKLKKLMSIDPFHPQVVKNADLLHKRSSSVIIEPIASLDNIQKFRDINFDMKAQFGISDFEQDPLRQLSKRYDVGKRAQLVEKEQQERMSLIMNGLISRSDARIQKFSSPKKRQVSNKLN